ncbi:hypothetical protein [Clostridium sp. BJN0013]
MRNAFLYLNLIRTYLDAQQCLSPTLKKMGVLANCRIGIKI